MTTTNDHSRVQQALTIARELLTIAETFDDEEIDTLVAGLAEASSNRERVLSYTDRVQDEVAAAHAIVDAYNDLKANAQRLTKINRSELTPSERMEHQRARFVMLSAQNEHRATYASAKSILMRRLSR